MISQILEEAQSLAKEKEAKAAQEADAIRAEAEQETKKQTEAIMKKAEQDVKDYQARLNRLMSRNAVPHFWPQTGDHRRGDRVCLSEVLLHGAGRVF